MQLHQAKIKGRLGMNFVERVALDANCKPIPVPEDLDTGIDGFLEFGARDDVSRLIAFQVKRGTSYFDDLGPKCRVHARHLSYWRHYEVPVFLIVVRDDESEAFWMDVREYSRAPRRSVEGETVVLRLNRHFSAVALAHTLRRSAMAYGFDDAVAALTNPDAGTRLSALSHLYRYRAERRTPFCLAAALRIDSDQGVIGSLCDFYSRYLAHPETPFGVDRHLSSYAATLLTHFPEGQLLRVLEAFGENQESADCELWDGTVEIFNLAEDQIWVRHDVIARGSLQQGIGQVLRHVATPEQLIAVATDARVSLSSRRSAVAAFGYLGYTCDTEQLDGLIAGARDAPLLALLMWVRYWTVRDLELVRHPSDSGR